MKCQGQTQGFTGLCSSYSSRSAGRQGSLSLLQGIFLTPENLQKKMNLAFPWLLCSSMPKGKQLQEDVENQYKKNQLIDQCLCLPAAQYLLANDVFCLNKTKRVFVQRLTRKTQQKQQLFSLYCIAFSSIILWLADQI